MKPLQKALLPPTVLFLALTLCHCARVDPPDATDGFLAIWCNVGGAALKLGSQALAQATSASATIVIPASAGAHDLIISKSGFTSQTRSVSIATAQTTVVSFTLCSIGPDPGGGVQIISQPAGADIYVDGMDTGRVTPASISLANGQSLRIFHENASITHRFSAGATKQVAAWGFYRDDSVHVPFSKTLSVRLTLWDKRLNDGSGRLKYDDGAFHVDELDHAYPTPGPIACTTWRQASGVSAGGQYWRLIQAVFENDQSESGGNHNVYYDFWESDGTTKAPQTPFLFGWPGTTQDRVADKLTDPHIGQADMYAQSWTADQGPGPYYTYVKGLPSETVGGMGMHSHFHVNYVLSFLKAARP